MPLHQPPASKIRNRRQNGGNLKIQNTLISFNITILILRDPFHLHFW